MQGSLNHALCLQEQLLGGWRSLEGGLLHKALRDPTKAADKHALLQLLSQALGIAGGGGETNKFDPQELQLMEVSHARLVLKSSIFYICSPTPNDVSFHFYRSIILTVLTSLYLISWVTLPKPLYVCPALFLLCLFVTLTRSVPGNYVINSSFSQGVLLTGGVLQVLTCGEGKDSELNRILSVPEKQQSVLRAYQTAVCGGDVGQKAERFAQISQELRDQIDTQKIIEKVQYEE